MWIYNTLPVGRVELVANVEQVVAGTPISLWKQYGARTGLARDEFFDYVAGCATAYFILVTDIEELSDKPTLGALRRAKRGFHPPQFAKMIERDSALYRALSAAVA